MVNPAKIYISKLVPKSKSNKSLKLLLVDMKASSSMLVRSEITGITKTKQRCLIFIMVSQVREENQISDKEVRNCNNYNDNS